MYRLLILSFFICCSCNKIVKEEIQTTQYKIDMKYYAGVFDTINESVDVDKTVINNFTRYIYYYENLKDENDTLLIGPESISINNEKLTLLGQKKFKIDDKIFAVKKYKFSTPYSTSEVYLDANGIILRRIWSHTKPLILRYDPKTNSPLQKQLVKDTAFFKLEY